MGVVAHITIERIARGEFLVLGDPIRHPSFVATEPVAILYGRFERIGGVGEHDGWTNVVFPDEWTGLAAYSRSRPLVVIPGAVALVVVPQREIRKSFPDVWARWSAPGGWWGALAFPDLVEVWGKIVPGRWAVTDYSVTGMGDDAPCFHADLPAGAVADTKVEWRLWT